MTHRTIPIAGMTCAACEVTVAEAALALPSVKSAKASARTGLLTVAGDVSNADIAAALAGTPYKLGDRPWWSKERTVWRDAAIGVGVVLVLAVIVMALGLDERVQQATQSAGTGSLLLVAGLGAAASVSTCMALVGGLVLALSASGTSTAPARTRMRPHLAFNLGRVAGFGTLGAVIGGAGQALAISGTALAVLMLVVALVMALLGLRLTQVSPRIAGWQAALPSSWGRWARTAPADASAQSASRRDLRAMGLGAATFFLP